MKKLGFGMMRLPMIGNEIDIEQTKLMVDEFISGGFTYFDTAYPYHDGKSECAVKQCIVDRYPREAYTITTKLPTFDLKEKEDNERIFNDQKKKTGLAYFDYYWLHAMSEKYLDLIERCGCWDFIKEKKTAGEIRHIGFSFHDSADVLDDILNKHPEVEFVQLQINYLDWEAENVQSRRCYEVCVKHDKPVIVMEPVKGGTLVKVPETVESKFKEIEPNMSNASWAIRFAASLDNVYMVLSGMSNLDQVRDNISSMQEFKPLNDRELKMCLNAGELIKNLDYIPCTGCNYCTVNCPMSIDIPKYFTLFNDNRKGVDNRRLYLDEVINNPGPADCLECGECEKLCPQHLHIRKYLKRVTEHYGE